MSGVRDRPRSIVPPALRDAAPELAELLVKNVHDGIAILDTAGRLVLWNPAAATITGWTEKEAAARKFGNVVKLPAGMSEIRQGKWVELRHSALVVSGRRYKIVFFIDATAQRRLRDAREDLRDLGLIDAVTELPGQQLALRHLERALALARRDDRSVGLVSLKLDRDGKSDAAIVDALIRPFAKRMAAYVRASDLPARSDDDRFLVVLTAMSATNDATVVADRLLLALAEPFVIDGRARRVGFSIGIAEYPRDEEDAAALVSAAHAASDRAQRLGGGRCCSAAEAKSDDEP